MNIIAYYKPPNKTLSQQEWGDIMDTTYSENTILLGDFNAHHPSWNCDAESDNGKKLYNAIEKNNLYVHNTDTYTRINPQNGKESNLDLIISTSDLDNKINTVCYDEALWSDHFPILSKLSVTKTPYVKKSFRIQSKRTNWVKVNKILAKKFTKFYDLEYESATPSLKFKIFTDTYNILSVKYLQIKYLQIKFKIFTQITEIIKTSTPKTNKKNI